MTPTIRDPFKDLLAIQERMNRLLEAALTEPNYGDDLDSVGAWTPSSDVYETEESLIICCELPGLTDREINISMAEGVLTIRGEREMDREGEGEGERFHRIERSYGRFCRAYNLPVAVDAERIAASFRDGVLMVTLAKKPRSEPRRIEVRAD